MHESQFDPQLCRQCRGRCCQGHPGLWSEPQRFFAIFSANTSPSPEQFCKILHQHQLTLRDLGGILIPAPQETEQGCIALDENGCSYSSSERPCQCLALIPDLETLLDDQIHCRLPAEYGSGTARENWRPYQELLLQVRLLLTGPKSPFS